MEGAAPPLFQRPQRDPCSPTLVGCSTSLSGGCHHQQGCSGGEGCKMNGCEDCVAWRQYLYWNHPGGGGRRQFIVRASDGFRESVCIPQEAANQLRNLIPDWEPIKLEGPDGHMYNVEHIKFGWIYLWTGWPEFVDANHIQEGDYILFVYCGSSSFKVHIFSSSGHESSQQPPGVFAPINHCHCHALDEQVVADPAHVESSTTDFGYTTFPGTCLTQEQEKKVLELAQTSMMSEFPLHVAAVNKRNANEDDCYLCIPLRLLDNFNEGITIQLEAHGNKILYSVGASKHSGDQIILQSGLSFFVASHRIQKNVDILVFRSKGKARLEVLVLDPSGCERTPCSAMGNSSNAREIREDSVQIVDKKPPLPPTVVDVSSDDDEIVGKDMAMPMREKRPLLGCRAKARKMASTSPPCTKSEHKAGSSNEESSLEAPVPNNPESRYMLPERTILIGQQEEKVKEKVRAIGSEFPVFVKVMTAHHCLDFCKEYASACLPVTETPLLLRLEGSKTTWPTVLFARKQNNRRRIHKCWKDLVSQAGMEKGDICLIELADKSSEGLAMTVHVIRKSEMQL